MLRLLRDNNNGAVMVITLALITIITILSAAFASMVTFKMRNANWQLHRAQSFYLTEAGLDKAIALLKDDDNWSQGADGSATDNFPGDGEWYPLHDPNTGTDVNNITIGDDIYPVSVKLCNLPGSNGKKIDIISGGEFGDSRRVIQVRMLLSSSSPFAWAAFGAESVTITGSAYIDSYNSDNGLYGGGNIGENGNVGSNDDIRVTGSATIAGNATCGPDPDDELRITGSANITGSTDPASELVELPPLEINFPSSPSGQLKKTGSGTYTLTDGIYCFTDIQFTGSHELRTEGDVTIYCESLSFTGTSKIRVNGKLTFYCTGDFKCTGSGIINTNKKPADFTLYCTGEDIKLTGSTDFYGAVYVSVGDVTITGSHDYYGAIIAGGEVKGTGNCMIHYDEALAVDTEQQFTTVSWHEVDQNDPGFKIVFPDN